MAFLAVSQVFCQPKTTVLTIRKGKHKIVIEHYEVDGFSTLDFRLTPVK